MQTYDLELRNVHKTYPNGHVAVREFNLKVKKGEFVAFLGPSGCGKTTTLRMIGGFEEPTAGDIFIKEQRTNHIPANQRRTNMVFQNFALFPHMNVRENMEYGLKLKGMDPVIRRKKTNDSLELVQMQEFAERSIDELSGGQRQRIAIARSLVMEPDILLLDEPLGALDTNLRSRVQAELKALQKHLGITFIFVTHSQSEAMALSDQIVVMSNGEIEQIGSPEEVYSRPKTRFVAQFVGKNNIFDGEIQSTKGDLLTILTREGPIMVEGEQAKKAPSLGKVSLVVRADQTQLIPLQDGNCDPEWNYLEGKLRGEEIVGSIISYLVELPKGLMTKVEQHESLSDFSYHLNDTVCIRWKKSDAILL